VAFLGSKTCPDIAQKSSGQDLGRWAVSGQTVEGAGRGKERRQLRKMKICESLASCQQITGN